MPTLRLAARDMQRIIRTHYDSSLADTAVCTPLYVCVYVTQVHDQLGGNVARLQDLARLSLIYTGCGKIERAASVEMAASGLRIAQLKNRFASPTPLGYSDINATVELILDHGDRFVSSLFPFATLLPTLHVRIGGSD